MLLVGWLAWSFLERAPATLPRVLSNGAESRVEIAEPTASKPAQVEAQAARAVATDLDRADLTETIPLLVLDRPEGSPVSAAQVWVYDWPEEPSLLTYELGALESHLKAKGRSLRTDERGEARLPRTQRKASVFASHAGDWAADAYTASDQRVVLCLIAERALEVHVTRSTGADVVGMDVVLRSIDWFGIRYHVQSDERGIATFRHLRAFQRREGLQPAEVTVQAPFDRHPALKFESVMDMPSRVELVIPACGALEVELLGLDGAPIEAACFFELKCANAGVTEASHTNVQRRTPTGRTRFENVEVGIELVVSGSIVGVLGRAEERVRGPERDGQTAQLILRLQSPTAAGFRAVDERGTVLAQHTLRGSAQDRDPSGDFDEPFDLWERVTDETGRFQLEFPNSAGEAGNRRRFELLTTRKSDGVVLHGRIELEALGASKELERGDVQFRPAELLAAGRVSDERGVPVAGAQVFLRPRDTESEPFSRRELTLHPAHILSDANGEFEARGQMDATLISINAGSPDERFACEPIDVRKGASDVQLCLPRHGRLTGTLILPEEVWLRDLSVSWKLNVKDAPTNHASLEDASEPRLSRFRFAVMPAGLGNLSISAGNQVLYSISNVSVQHGEPTLDPRLERIDLRDRIRVLKVWVDLPDGSPAKAGLVLTRLENAPRQAWSPWAVKDGLARCVLGLEPVDLSVEIKGCREETRLSVRQAALRVRLREPFEIHVEFRAAKLPGELQARLQNSSGRLVNHGDATPNPAGATIRWAVLRSGPATVTLLGRDPAAENSPSQTLGSWKITIADVETPQTFVLDVTE